MSNPMSLSTSCSFCGAQPGACCHTRTGEPAVNQHARRWDDIRHARSSRPAVYRLRHDDDRMQLFENDLLLCVPYPYDSKQSVLRRLSDGFEPDCNQYNASLEFVDWADQILDDAQVLSDAEDALRGAHAAFSNAGARLTLGVL